MLVQDLQRSFRGDFQGQTRHVVNEPLGVDAEQRMADYLGLKRHERAKPTDRVDSRNMGLRENVRASRAGLLFLLIYLQFAQPLVGLLDRPDEFRDARAIGVQLAGVHFRNDRVVQLRGAAHALRRQQ